MKKIILLASLIAGSFFANAQFKLGLNAGVAVPVGTLSEMGSLGFGGGLGAKYFVSDHLAIDLNAGYYMLGKKKVDAGGFGSAETSTSIIPIQAGVEYYFTEEGFRPFIGIDLGYYSFNVKSKADIMGMKMEVSDSKGYVGIAPKVGFLAALSDNVDLGLNAQYNYIFADIINEEGEKSAAMLLGVNASLFFTLGGK